MRLVAGFVAGNASGAALIGSTVTTDLPATATNFKIPYYIIQGRDDLFAPTPLAKAYFDKVSAPKKQFVIIEDEVISRWRRIRRT